MTTDPHEDLIEAAATTYAKTNPFLTRADHEDAIRSVVALIAERTKDATPEMLDAAMGIIPESDPTWRAAKRLALIRQFPVMHRVSALWPKEKP